MRVRVPSDTVSSVGRAAHDAGLAALLGGNLYGRLAMHPSLGEISDSSERGKVLNHAWRRYSWVNSLSLLAIVSGWAGARAGEARPGQLSARERTPAWPRRSRAFASRASFRMAGCRSPTEITLSPRHRTGPRASSAG
jgi:hypothetical protein